MASAKVKPIHLIYQAGGRCKAVCSYEVYVRPLETIIGYVADYMSKGTYNPDKVTCKRCLNHPDYKIALDKINYPLFFIKEGIV